MIELSNINNGKVTNLGHRGAMGHAPENTMASFRTGVEMGADAIEFDIHLNADNDLVVIHDPRVDRTTNGSGAVREMTTSKIRSLDAGSHFSEEFAGEMVPLLPEVLEWAKGTIDLVIEIKGGHIPAPGIEDRLVDEIRNFSLQDHVMVISFHHATVKCVKEIDPSIATGILYTGRPVDAVAMARAALADSIRFGWNYAQPDDIRAAHDAGLCVNCWTANTEEQFVMLTEAGADSIGSNYPDLLRTWIDRKGLAVL